MISVLKLFLVVFFYGASKPAPVIVHEEELHEHELDLELQLKEVLEAEEVKLRAKEIAEPKENRFFGEFSARFWG